MPELVRVNMTSIWVIPVLAAVSGMGPPVASAQPAELPPPMADGRMFGHLPYIEAEPAALVPAPPGFAIGPSCLLHRDVAPDLARLLAAAAQTPGVGTSLRGVSCFRPIARQRAVFCRNGRPGVCADAIRRARSVGPPGYSEHATGYAIDFGIRPAPRCADVSVCIAATPGGRWLLAHGADYGFELSFPHGNAQGVTWEPWHWRWVGATIGVPGAARARLTFARARASYPGSPAVADVSDAWLTARAPATTPLIVEEPVAVPPPPVIPGPVAPQASYLTR